MRQSTTPAGISLCNTLIIKVLRPPLLQKEGKFFNLHTSNSTLRLTAWGWGAKRRAIQEDLWKKDLIFRLSEGKISWSSWGLEGKSTVEEGSFRGQNPTV